MDIFWNKENLRPSSMLIATGISAMLLSESVQFEPIRQTLMTTGKTFAVSGVMTGLAEDAIIRKL